MLSDGITFEPGGKLTSITKCTKTKLTISISKCLDFIEIKEKVMQQMQIIRSVN